MKTTQLLVAALLATGIFTMNAQNSIQTTSLTSYGIDSGTTPTNGAFYGYWAGKTATGAFNSFFGRYAGAFNTTGGANTFIGDQAGYANISGTENTNVGNMAGKANTSGQRNVFVGSQAGPGHTTGTDNIFIGYVSGVSNKTGTFNVIIGSQAGIGASPYNGSNNTIIGSNAGGAKGSNNVFIGASTGQSVVGSDLLFIDNSTDTTPLIWGNFATDQLKFNATKVGIGMDAAAFPGTVAGVNTSAYKLFVNGGIVATEVRVATGWADYVFENNYNLCPLEEVECFIDENGHLPNVPSAKQVEAEGIEVGQMAKIQQEKIEELTLYLIEQNKLIKEQMQVVKQQQQQIDELKAEMAAMKQQK